MMAFFKASSEIAALLLPERGKAHYIFKIPIHCDGEGNGHISVDSDFAQN